MTRDNVFGSGALTPELLRTTTFEEVDGRVDAAEVRRFLEHAASALEVFMSADAPTALRAEFARNAEIAQQVLDAAQDAAEQLRRQAGEEARKILDETREATMGLRSAVDGELAESRAQVESMRAQLMQDLRDLYDRIGASLYRFERAADADRIEPINEPARGVGSSEPAPEAAAAVSEVEIPSTPTQLAGAVTPDPFHDDEEEAGGTDLSTELKAPAWQQLPPEAWGTEPVGPVAEAPPAAPGEVPAVAPVAAATTPPATVVMPAAEVASSAQVPVPVPVPAAPAAAAPAVADPPAAAEPVAMPPLPDPFAVVEDEPLAPGEPLVDLRELGAAATEPADASPPTADLGGSWLAEEPAAAAPDAAPTTAPAAPAPTEGGSWLDAGGGDDVAAAAVAPAPGDVAPPYLAHDDALAEALIAGSPFPEAAAPTAPTAPAAPEAPTTDAPPADIVPAAAPAAPAAVPAVAPVAPAEGASADAVAVRQLILDSLAAGQTRETVEAYLREHLGLLEPGALIDAAIGSSGVPRLG